MLFLYNINIYYITIYKKIKIFLLDNNIIYQFKNLINNNII